MKPLGMFLAITSTAGESAPLDDDYDWHVRQRASEAAAAAPTRPTRLASITERLRKLDRLLARTGVSPARRA